MVVLCILGLILGTVLNSASFKIECGDVTIGDLIFTIFISLISFIGLIPGLPNVGKIIFAMLPVATGIIATTTSFISSKHILDKKLF